jgi:3-methyladenine DNA glycosylase AlkC
MSKVQRKGVRRTADISIDCLASLNRGEIETANLVEWLAVDQRLLLAHILQQNARIHYLKPILLLLEQLQKPTVNSINETIGRALFDMITQNRDNTFLTILFNHPADLVRCWATYAIGNDKQLEIEELLSSIRPFAADTHFGVREISWMGIRNRIAFDLDRSITYLSLWAIEKDENVRRFATESTRPRGVWCKHIDRLKQEPSLALPILEPLKSDPSKYVRDSVANWLNDASKSQPGFVRALCHRWEEESNTKETHYIIRKALRTISK